MKMLLPLPNAETMKRKEKLTLDKSNQYARMQMPSLQMTPKYIYQVPIPASVF
jgi:hypothetical protein